MVTLDLSDQAVPGRLRGLSRARDLLLPADPSDPGMRVLQRVLVADVMATVAAVLLAMGLVFYDFTGWALLTVVLWPLAMARSGAYDRKRLLNQGVTANTVVRAASRVVVACAVVGLFVMELDVRQSLRLTAFLLAATALSRWSVAFWLRRRRRVGDLLIPVFARGRADDLRSFIAMVGRDPAPTMEVVAVQCTDCAPLESVPGVSQVPLTTDPVDAAARNAVSAVVIVGPTDLPSETLRRTIWGCEQKGIDTLILPIIEPVAPPRVRTVHRGGAASMVFQGPNRRLFRVKRVMDRFLAGLGLLFLAPLLIAVAVAIRANTPGPALFRQTRVGREGAHFTMLKFRTMGVDAEARRAELAELNQHAGGTLFKVRQDPRITSVGRILRKYSLDELPQLINVVRGEMSLVGPRPPLPEEVANYPVDFRRRFAVNPGLTGLWQVSGRSDLDPLDAARLDTQYVEHWSMGMDLRILVRTAKVVVMHDGAY